MNAYLPQEYQAIERDNAIHSPRVAKIQSIHVGRGSPGTGEKSTEAQPEPTGDSGVGLPTVDIEA